MRKFILIIIFALISNLGFAQSLTISENSSTRNNSTNQFLIAGHQITINNNSPSYVKPGVSSDVNSLTAISTALNGAGVTIYSGSGKELFTASHRLESDDSSVKVYIGANGEFIVRENIANFLFYNALGNIQQSVSNSSQSSEGESISELAADLSFKTVVLYNPKIMMNGQEGSRAKVVKANGATTNIFDSSDRAIRLVNVSENGQFIGVASYKSGTDDELIIMDRFGNELVSLSFDQRIVDFKFSKKGDFITIRSNGRVGVYSVLDGERKGSTSFRSTLHLAEYMPEDETIIALTAEKTGSILSDVEFHAVNLSARSIERQAYGSSLGTSPLISAQLNRTGSSRYTLTGLSKELTLNVH